MEKIIDIIESIANEKNLPTEAVSERVERAIISTAKHLFGQDKNFSVDVSKTLCVYQTLTVVADDDERAQPGSEQSGEFITLSKAKEAGDVEIGDVLNYEISFANLDRTAINWLYKELEFQVQKLLEEKLLEKYQSLQDKLIYGAVTHIDSDENTFIELDEVRAILPRKSRIKGEKFKPGDVIKAIIRSVRPDRQMGIRVEISRTSPKFLTALLALEVPEIKDGAIEVINCARIPGERAKVLLRANTPTVDPVGATVGTKGVRINAISAELCGENIDCIEHSSEAAINVARALAPAIVSSVAIEGESARVLIASDQKSKAIGKSGVNIRLCGMLTGLDIELIEQGGARAASSEASETASSSSGDGASASENLENLFKNI